MKISSLYIKSFRGATKPVTIDFDPGKSITMIFGENGNGKSTIADALVCLCRDDHGTIDRPSADKSYLCSLGATSKDVEIRLECDSGKYSATLAPKKAGQFIKSPDKNIPELRLLRRKQIIDLIDELPSERYKKFQEYIDVSGVISSEDQLRSLTRTVSKELDNETSTLANAETTLERAWTQEGSPGSSWESWAKKESSADVSLEKERLQLLNKVVRHWEDLNTRVRSVTENTSKLQVAKNEVDTCIEALEKLEKKGGSTNVELLSVLQSANTYITHQEDLTSCPVCSNDIVRGELLANLQREIQAMSSLNKANNDVLRAKTAVETTEAVHKKSVQDLGEQLAAYCGEMLNIVESGSKEGGIINLLAKSVKENSQLEALKSNVGDLDALMASIDKEKTTVDRRIQQFNLIKSNYDSIISSRSRRSSLAVLKDRNENANKIVQTARKKFIEDELNSVSNDIENLYGQIHPGEKIGEVKLLLKETGKNSIEIRSKFYSENGITPQSLYSESHLDTLGICIFLALARKYSAKDTILLLDDVMMSVDELHLDKFIEVLHDVSKDFGHVVITTHYRPWRDRYRNNRADGSKVHFVELRQWSLDRGIGLQNGKIISQELRELLASSTFHREFISNTAGRVLENLLDFLTFKFGCKLIRKPRNDYALRELLDALSSKLVKVLKVEHMVKDETGKFSTSEIKKTQELKASIDKIKSLSAVRNQVGAHFSFEGSSVSDHDVKEFGELTLELADLLTCPELGSLPDRKPSGSYWQTKSGSVRLYPLQEPT